MNELAHGGFALGGVLLAVKIFRDDNLGGEHPDHDFGTSTFSCLKMTLPESSR